MNYVITVRRRTNTDRSFNIIIVANKTVRIRRVKTNTEIHSKGFETLLPIKQGALRGTKTQNCNSGGNQLP